MTGWLLVGDLTGGEDNDVRLNACVLDRILHL